MAKKAERALGPEPTRRTPRSAKLVISVPMLFSKSPMPSCPTSFLPQPTTEQVPAADPDVGSRSFTRTNEESRMATNCLLNALEISISSDSNKLPPRLSSVHSCYERLKSEWRQTSERRHSTSIDQEHQRYSLRTHCCPCQESCCLQERGNGCGRRRRS